MTPEACAGLSAIAKHKGLRLGVWLEQLALIRGPHTGEAEEESDTDVLSRRFELGVIEAAEITEELLDVVDEQPSAAKNDRVKSKLRALSQAHEKLFQFLCSERVLTAKCGTRRASRRA